MNMNKQYRRHHTYGFTLVEILVSLAISSILMLGVIEVFSSSKRSSKVNEAISRVQENARFAMEAIITDFRKAGYVGCNPDNLNSFVDTSADGYGELFNLNSGTGGWEYDASSTKPVTTTLSSPYVIPATFNIDTALSDWSAAGNVDLPAALEDKIAPGTDIIVVKWAEALKGVTGKSNNNSKNAVASTTAPHGIPTGGIAILSNCKGGDAFVNVSAADNTLTRGVAAGWEPPNTNAAEDWSQAWTDNTQIMGVQSRAYYIGKGAGGGPALWRAHFSYGLEDNGTSLIVFEELAEGIENMQVLYAVDSDDNGVIDSYNTAENVSHAQVVGIQLGMIARSDSESLSTAKVRKLNVIGTIIQTPNDRRLRYVFSSTTKLRNKGVR